MADLPGAFGETKEATEAIQRMCDEVKLKVEELTHKTYVEFEAVKFMDGVTMNFFIKVHVGGVNYIHLWVFKPLGGHVELRGVQQHKTKDDPLVPFEN
ncbi:cystatin-A1-like [Chaetodon trifascialis]|uniref:cystatin-A1-like n=1 Tax=Chaetodon trifascialis TaxID=109706 RepID=UPI0039949CB5